MALHIKIKVIPGSGRNGWKMDPSGQLKCYLKSQPEKGAANKELRKMLAKMVGVTQDKVEIFSGLTQRIKKITIYTDISFNQLLSLLGIDYQQSLFEKK